MLTLLDLILSLGEFVLSWRLYVGLALTAAACWLAFAVAPEPARWVVVVPVGLVGIFLGVRWQVRADEASAANR